MSMQQAQGDLKQHLHTSISQQLIRFLTSLIMCGWQI